MDRSKQLKLGVILSYLSTGINIVVQLVYTPLMLRLLGQSEYACIHWSAALSAI